MTMLSATDELSKSKAVGPPDDPDDKGARGDNRGPAGASPAPCVVLALVAGLSSFIAARSTAAIWGADSSIDRYVKSIMGYCSVPTKKSLW